MKIPFSLVLTIGIMCFGLSTYPSKGQAKNQPNVLFIGIDDLRPELGCYGSDIAISPNLDKLAGQGLLFERAYCQQAICGPSRASLLTGLRPETSGVTHNYIKIRDQKPNIVTLPQHFMLNGYEAVYCGKIFHHGDKDDELSWSRKPATDKVDASPFKLGYALEENRKIAQDKMQRMLARYGEVARLGLGSGPAFECADVPDNAYADGYNTDLAIATLKEMVADNSKPFFLGLGFHKPHLNWVAPKRYWDLYDSSRIELATQVNPPQHAAEMGLHASFELRTRYGIPKEGEFDPALARTLKHAYLACISYVDAQIGRMIEALEESGALQNTIIIVWSDHGWHLGEMGIWGKATNYEIATRVPMIIWTPDMEKNIRGTSSSALVELVDIYPTLCELAGINKPRHLEGQSFVPLLANPKQNWKPAVFSQFPSPALREWGSIALRPAMRETFFGDLIVKVEERIIDQQEDNWNREFFENHLMGYAMRTNRYRLVVWKDRRVHSSKPLFVELFDHQTDPTESVNIAEDEPVLVDELLTLFNSHWTAAHSAEKL